ncbi:SDR family NAD(P)-dependent oxidoreductase [Amycolatopsis rubida]|uniref:SDR family NAD(P)-dependent oxidoreductase n=1 Tax=Amycolatopsis rubida TaxID=112413 RepID=A0ABX0BQU7_9PSEU|nr:MULTISPECIES: SDR family NAD(P)-dependent oxidoreductase [Amycolatopsis]MYW90983.1 SDR family NAD(P)-dependent oxidoreductase [Amycolatopsis rubida]NEC55968.1 SDR family NAD(P)-dependent oxidoreductase [Amycolatopsis rubida]
MPKAVHPERIDGQTVAITGATSGIGFFAAAQPAELGARVLVLGRSESRGHAAVSALPNPRQHEFLPLDLADRTSIASAGDRLGAVPRLDALVLNAGVVAGAFGPGPAHRIGAFGVEEIVGINHLAHAELLRRALPAVRRDAAIASLGRGGESIEELAQRLGFSEASAFRRAFRRWTGQSPGDFR